jgi:hypothetical protein
MSFHKNHLESSFFTSRRDEPVNEYLNGEIINFDALSMGFTNLVSTVQPDFVINCIGAIKPLIKESERNLLLMHKLLILFYL